MDSDGDITDCLSASLWDHVFSFVGAPSDLAVLSCVCNRFHVIITSMDACWIVAMHQLPLRKFLYKPLLDALPRPRRPDANGGVTGSGLIDSTRWQLGLSNSDTDNVPQGTWRLQVQRMVHHLTGRTAQDARAIVEGPAIYKRLSGGHWESTRSSEVMPQPSTGDHHDAYVTRYDQLLMLNKQLSPQPPARTTSAAAASGVGAGRALSSSQPAAPSRFASFSGTDASWAQQEQPQHLQRVSVPRNDGTVMGALKHAAAALANSAIAKLEGITSPPNASDNAPQTRPVVPTRQGSSARLSAEQRTSTDRDRHSHDGGSFSEGAADDADVALTFGDLRAFTEAEPPASVPIVDHGLLSPPPTQPQAPDVATPPGAVRICLLAACEGHITSVLSRLNAAGGGEGKIIPRTFTARFTAWDLIIAAVGSGSTNGHHSASPFACPLHITALPVGHPSVNGGMDAFVASNIQALRQASGAGSSSRYDDGKVRLCEFDAFVIVADASAVYTPCDLLQPDHVHIAEVIGRCMAVMTSAGYDPSVHPLLVLAEGQQHTTGNPAHAQAALEAEARRGGAISDVTHSAWRAVPPPSAAALTAQYPMVPPLTPVLVSYLLRKAIAGLPSAAVSDGLLWAVVGTSLDFSRGGSCWGVETGFRWLHRVLRRLWSLQQERQPHRIRGANADVAVPQTDALSRCAFSRLHESVAPVG